MLTWADSTFIAACIEGFLYGLYSGIFTMYLRCPPRESRSATILFYILCLLYLLSTVTIVSDLLAGILDARIRTLSSQLQIDSQSKLLFRVLMIQITVGGCCDFITQCILIYRCWIVWDKSIRVIIVPSFLAIGFIATWLAANGAITIKRGLYFPDDWGITMTLTGLAASMAVNALVTGLIVFKIFKVFLEVKASTTSPVDKTLLGSTGCGTKLRHVIFVIIESGMALFAIQLVRLVITSLMTVQAVQTSANLILLNLIIGVHEMLNGITPTIILVRVSMKLSFDDKESFMEAAAGGLHSSNSPNSSDPNTASPLRRVESSSSSMPPQERSEESDCFDNPPNDPNTNTLWRVESSSSMPSQERSEESEDIYFNNPPSDPNTPFSSWRVGSSNSSSSMSPQGRNSE